MTVQSPINQFQELGFASAGNIWSHEPRKSSEGSQSETALEPFAPEKGCIHKMGSVVTRQLCTLCRHAAALHRHRFDFRTNVGCLLNEPTA